MQKRILCLVPSLGPDVIATAEILETAGLLDLLITRGAPTPALARFLARSSITRSFSRRPASPVRRELTVAKWTADFVFYLVLALTQSRTRATDASFAFLDRLAAKCATPKLGAVFAREDCCVRTFRRAKRIGVRSIYQLPTAYWRLVKELMLREIEEFPDICRAAADQREFAGDRVERKDVELSLADLVLCPSTFVQHSLKLYEGAAKHTECIPFASDRTPSSREGRSRKGVFLYVGNITMRKGVHRLLMAWKKIKGYRTHQLRLVGDMYLSETFLNDFRGMFTHIKRLPREELREQYSEAVAFVFNPVADGFGHVILEASSHRLPVLSSRNCGAPDAITHKREGILFDYGDEAQLTNALDWALTNPTELQIMGEHAFLRSQRWRWEDYGARFLECLRGMIT